ncbi:BAD_collapsed_G0047570.mRNA.1.CDS.1 [Saccharomyces cerevisiae]|nr:BAD_collapsed_G0047570.mRNA.1.CDS.1 [Saccharomyces cerevisiae]
MSDSQQSITVLEELFRKLETATSETREGISSELSSFLNGNIIEHDVPEVFFDEFQKAIQSKQKALNTLGAVAYIANETNLSPSVEPYIVATVPSVCSKAGSKDNDVQLAATKALKAIASAVNPVAVKALLPHLIHSLETSNKWKEKVAVLEVISVLVDAAKEQIALRMPELIPVLSESMWDTKKEVKEAATATITKATETVDNKDIERFIPKLIECIANPNEVPETVHLLGATTFVAEVTPATLSIMVPLLSRGLAERETSIKRKAAVIIDNMCKLVEDPQVVAPFLGKLLPGLKNNFATIADPEAREVTLKALKTLRRVGNVGEDDVLPEISHAGDVSTTLGVIKELLEPEKVAPRFTIVVEYIAAIAANLIDERIIDQQTWFTHVTPYMTIFLHEKTAKEILDDFRKRAVDNIPVGPNFQDEEDEGEDLCNCEFSLAYGAKILLNKTQLRLKRGRRYGLCGPNGAGKSTLMRSIANGQVDGFPTQDECRTVYVEHDIDNTHSDMSVLDFVYSGNVGTKDVITSKLKEFGFSDEMIEMPISSLSGGWKMKLALARAVLKDADILLLDEPTNHLDTVNVEWLVNYLNTCGITSVIVSHDSGFLDKVCQYIIHYEGLKLRKYRVIYQNLFKNVLRHNHTMN